MNISPRTVESFLTEIRERVKVDGRIKLATRYVQEQQQLQ